MASNYEVMLSDFDSRFAAYVAGSTSAPVTDYKVVGSDLNTRYQNIIYGTAASATGYKRNNADLNTFFCAIGTNWTASLPSFPNIITTSPQTSSMTVSLSGGPGGTYTYNWTYTTDSGTCTFSINSGQGTPTINYTATGTSGEPGRITITCSVTATNGAGVQASTVMRFDVPGGG